MGAALAASVRSDSAAQTPMPFSKNHRRPQAMSMFLPGLACSRFPRAIIQLLEKSPRDTQRSWLAGPTSR